MAKVEIVGVAHAFIKGYRGNAGGAPSKDSIFGLAFIGGTLTTFGGRRGGTMRFKTYKKTDLADQTARYTAKLSGNPFGKRIDAHYDAITDEAKKTELLGADFDEKLSKMFYAATFNKKLNTYSRVPKAKKAEMAAEAEKVAGVPPETKGKGKGKSAKTPKAPKAEAATETGTPADEGGAAAWPFTAPQTEAV